MDTWKLLEPGSSISMREGLLYDYDYAAVPSKVGYAFRAWYKEKTDIKRCVIKYKITDEEVDRTIRELIEDENNPLFQIANKQVYELEVFE